MCHVLQISRSGYYDWRERAECERSRQDRALLVEIRRVHYSHKQAYGAVKTWRALNRAGIACGKNRVARLRSLAGIEARRKRKFRLAYQSQNPIVPAPNLLRAPFQAATADRVWVGDVTFIPTRAGWLYLAVLIDLYSRLVVGWSMKDRPNQELVNEALLMAVEQRRPKPGLIHHTDQGRLYGSTIYTQLLSRFAMVRSMSRKGNCYDNAVAESFFSSLKNEVIHHQDFQTRDQARTAIFEYIELFYNRRRIHQSLDYETPLLSCQLALTLAKATYAKDRACLGRRHVLPRHQSRQRSAGSIRKRETTTRLASLRGRGSPRNQEI
jgi:transposase InsO family protein